MNILNRKTLREPKIIAGTRYPGMTVSGNERGTGEGRACSCIHLSCALSTGSGEEFGTQFHIERLASGSPLRILSTERDGDAGFASDKAIAD